MIIQDVPVIAKCRLKCSTSEVCSPELYFQSGSGTAGREKEHFLFYKVKRIQMGRISQFDLFSITGPGPCTEENAEQLKSMEAVGIERGREEGRERKRGGIGMRDTGK